MACDCCAKVESAQFSHILPGTKTGVFYFYAPVESFPRRTFQLRAQAPIFVPRRAHRERKNQLRMRLVFQTWKKKVRARRQLQQHGASVIIRTWRAHQQRKKIRDQKKQLQMRLMFRTWKKKMRARRQLRQVFRAWKGRVARSTYLRSFYHRHRARRDKLPKRARGRWRGRHRHKQRLLIVKRAFLAWVDTIRTRRQQMLTPLVRAWRLRKLKKRIQTTLRVQLLNRSCLLFCLHFLHDVFQFILIHVKGPRASKILLRFLQHLQVALRRPSYAQLTNRKYEAWIKMLDAVVAANMHVIALVRVLVSSAPQFQHLGRAVEVLELVFSRLRHFCAEMHSLVDLVHASPAVGLVEQKHWLVIDAIGKIYTAQTNVSENVVCEWAKTHGVPLFLFTFNYVKAKTYVRCWIEHPEVKQDIYVTLRNCL